jgi:hypothetical protein
MTCIHLLLSAVLTLGVLPPGHKEGREPAEADSLIVRGLALRRAGRPTDALALFRQAHDRSPSPRTLGHMGLVETSLQLWSDADAHLRAALATPDDPWVRQNRLFLGLAQARARAHVGELAVTGPPGARLSIAGREVGRLPLRAPLRLAEGDVRITATAEGRRPFSVDVTVQGGVRAAVTVVLQPDGPAELPPAPPRLGLADASSAGHRRWIGGALAVAGAGVLALGIGWLQVDGRCQTRSGNTGQCLSMYDTSTPGWAATATGAAMVIAGGAVWYLASRPSGAVWITAGARSVQLQGRF